MHVRLFVCFFIFIYSIIHYLRNRWNVNCSFNIPLWLSCSFLVANGYSPGLLMVESLNKCWLHIKWNAKIWEEQDSNGFLHHWGCKWHRWSTAQEGREGAECGRRAACGRRSSRDLSKKCLQAFLVSTSSQAARTRTSNSKTTKGTVNHSLSGGW